MKTLSSEFVKTETPPELKPDVEKVNSTTPTEPEKKEEVQDRPFSAEYFEVPEWGSLLLEPKLDVHGLTTKVLFIDNYLKEQLSKNSMNANKDSFRDILSDIENSLGLDSKHSVSHRVARVYGFLNVIKHAKEQEEIRKKRLFSILGK